MPTQDRARHSCEACRRKKSKCPAERPICSMCQRLKQQCVYLPRHATGFSHENSKVTKSKADKDRFDMLESQVANIYEIIQQFSGDDLVDSPSSSASRRTDIRASAVASRVLTEPTSFSNMTPVPFQPAIDECIQVYRTKIHAQPLQLFDVNKLANVLSTSSQYLLWSFLALTLKLCTPEFYDGKQEDAIAYYIKTAHSSIEDLARDGNARTDMVQSLCLLALTEVMSCTPAKAWMTIGMAGRVQTLRRMSHVNEHYQQEDADLKCHWAVFLLERMFCCRSPHSIQSTDSTPLPVSPSIPPPPLQVSNFLQPQYTTASDASDPSGFATPDPDNIEYGINVPCLKGVAIWGDIVSYMHDVRNGKSNVLGPSDPAYQRFTSEICHCDIQFSHSHLLRNVLIDKRSSEELVHNREYWSVWILTQIATHGSQALLNHPLVYLILPQDKSPAMKSRIFQQQTVDQTLFHSGWVARLIRIVEDAKLEINDPLVGNVVAAIATISWLFQFARDGKVAERAKRDFETCERLLSRLSKLWPHLVDKLNSLRELQLLAESTEPDTPRRHLTVTFKPRDVWKLLDSDISQTIRDGSDDQYRDMEGQLSTEAVVRVVTKIIHPLEEQRADGPLANEHHAQPDTQFGSYNALYTQESLDPSMLDMFLQLDPDDFQWTQNQM